MEITKHMQIWRALISCSVATGLQACRVMVQSGGAASMGILVRFGARFPSYRVKAHTLLLFELQALLTK